MAYSAPPTFVNGNVLTAAQLNILSDDVEYLYGLVSGVNIPFNSITTTINLRSNNNQWLLRHAYQYLHYKARVTANDNDDFDIFITQSGGYDIKVYTDSTTRSATYTYSGYIDLEDCTTWVSPASGDDDIYQGVYAGGTTYDQYDIVAYDDGGGTDYYYSNTGGNTGNTPSAGLPWVNLGDANFWTDGARYQMYVYTNLNSSYTFTLDYLLESDQTSL